MSRANEVLMDYTAVPLGWQIQGILSTGHVTKSTIDCATCGRVGLLAIRNGERLIVHSGHAKDKTLHAVDYCQGVITQH